MKHFASRAFWEAYDRLPKQVRDLADRNYGRDSGTSSWTTGSGRARW
jgi:hypothetical protein